MFHLATENLVHFSQLNCKTLIPGDIVSHSICGTNGVATKIHYLLLSSEKLYGALTHAKIHPSTQCINATAN